MAHSERARQWVHIGSGLFALLLRVLIWWQAAALAATALTFNLFLLPRIGGRTLYRPVDHARGFPLGIVLYPLSVLPLILVFETRLDIVAAAWGVLAFGAGFATLAGQRIGGRQIPWNREKTIAGTTAFVVCGGLGGIALAWWTRPAVVPPPPMLFVVVAPFLAAVAAALSSKRCRFASTTTSPCRSPRSGAAEYQPDDDAAAPPRR
jgi:dolichol kinase